VVGQNKRRQRGGVVADGVRNVVLLGERRDGDEWNAYAELIKIRAVCRIGTRGVGGHRRAELFRILHAGVRGAYGIAGTLRDSSGLLTRGRIGQILALTGVDTGRIKRVVLRRHGRRGMIVKTAVPVVGQENDGVFPVRTVPTGVLRRFRCRSHRP